MLGLGYQELMVILVIVMVLFGGSKLPELAKSLGKSVKEFKDGLNAEPVESKGPQSAPAAPAATATDQARCGYCKVSLEAAWSHCPHCGTVVAPRSPITPSN
ncbi:MAG TPA: twin-arginine translocase TatA/TatE family subunit [Candidatus Acidoferrum sp.]|nr:twin-arginine translocase TatA/TatE family subunit [Candidatus Acidoferrum sp.]